MRSETILHGPWRCQPDPFRRGEAAGFALPGYDDAAWRAVAVPSCFHAAFPDLEYYEGVFWYRTRFDLPCDPARQRIRLRCEAAQYRARVWLNGALIGEHADGWLPFSCDMSAAILPGGGNVLAIEVDSAPRPDDVPGPHVGWRRFGGLTREVRAQTVPGLHLDALRALAAPRDGGGELEACVDVRNDGDAPAVAEVDGVVDDGSGRILAELPRIAVAAAPRSRSPVRWRIAVPGARAWSPSSPALHRLRVRLRAGDGTVDGVEERIGFRTVRADAGGILLNGEPISLRGFNLHEDSPRTGMAFDPETMADDLRRMRAMGANFVRLCHYPHHPATLSLCDELGLLALAEVPLFSWRDRDAGPEVRARRAVAARRQLTAMIARDGNHPCIAIWSVSNETAEDLEDVQRANAELIRHARALDPSRLCVHVSNHWLEHPHFEEDDVVCINCYPSWGAAQRGDVAGDWQRRSVAVWLEELRALRARHPGKPILIAEFGYPAFRGSAGHAYGEDAAALAIAAESAALAEPYVAGMAVWCWADHAWRRDGPINGVTISPFGVLGRDRVAKPLPFAACARMLAGPG